MNDQTREDLIHADVVRAKRSYQARDAKMPPGDWSSNIYHPRHPLGFLLRTHNYASVVKGINSVLPDTDFGSLRILDVGCGVGHWLRFFVELNAKPENMTGVDVSEDRLNRAREANPGIQWIHSEGELLPFPSDSFDLVMQSVVFSSILDEGLRKTLAGEMERVTKTGGHILWIDHKKSFSNALAGFSKSKVVEYFPRCHIDYGSLVHPRYFRRRYRRCGWLSPVIYHFTKVNCDSWLLFLTKGVGGGSCDGGI